MVIISAKVIGVQSADRIKYCLPGKREIETIRLGFVNAGPLASPSNQTEKPFAYRAREEVRKALIGQTIRITVVQTGKFQTGFIVSYPNKVADPLETIFAKGYARFQNVSAIEEDENLSLLASKYQNIAAGAEARGAGVYSVSAGYDPCDSKVPGLRIVHFEPTKRDLDTLVGTEVNAVCEHVFGPDAISVYIPSIGLQTRVVLAGIDGKSVAIGKADDVRFEVTRRIYNQSIRLEVFGLDQYENFVCAARLAEDTSRDIGVSIVAHGFTKIADWSLRIASATFGQQMRDAEMKARTAQVGLWRGVAPPQRSLKNAASLAFTAELVDVRNADSLIVLNVETREESRVWLASVVAPRARRGLSECEPWFAEAWDLLRKLVAGQTLRIHPEYIRKLEPRGDKEEDKEKEVEKRTMVTVYVPSVGNVCVNTELIKTGLARPVHHRRDDLDRASNYGDLMAAHEEAQTKKRGQFSQKARPVGAITDVSDQKIPRRREEFGMLKGKTFDAVVTRLNSPTSLKLYIPSRGLLLPFSVAGVRYSSDDEEQTAAARAVIHLRDVIVTFKDLSNHGVFLGSIELPGAHEDYTFSLIKRGVCTLPSGRDARESIARNLVKAEEEAKAANRGVWKKLNQLEKERQLARAGSSSRVGTHAQFQEVIFTGFDPCGMRVFVRPTVSQPESVITRDDVETTHEYAVFEMKNKMMCAANVGAGWYRCVVLDVNLETARATVELVDLGQVREIDLAPESDDIKLYKLSEKAQSKPRISRVLQLGFITIMSIFGEEVEEALKSHVGKRVYISTFGPNKLSVPGRSPVTSTDELRAIIWDVDQLADVEQRMPSIMELSLSLNGEFVKKGYANVLSAECFPGMPEIIEEEILNPFFDFKQEALDDDAGFWGDVNVGPYADDLSLDLYIH